MSCSVSVLCFGYSGSTTEMAMPFRVRTSCTSCGRDGVAITTSGYFEPTSCRVLWSTNNPGRYSFVVMRVRYAQWGMLGTQVFRDRVSTGRVIISRGLAHSLIAD